MALFETLAGQLDRAAVASFKRTETLPGFDPGAMAKFYIQARAYTRLGQHKAAINSKTDFDLALYGKFGLDLNAAQTIAVHEIAAWIGGDPAEYFAAHSLINDSTSLTYSAQYATQLNLEINNEHLVIAKSRESHSRLLALIFGMNHVTPELEKLSLVYFQGRRRAAAAFAMKDDYPFESTQRQMLAVESFTSYYQRLDELVGIIETSLAVGPTI